MPPLPLLLWLHLTECIDWIAWESQLLHKIDNLLLAITDQYNELTILWGS